VSQCAGPIAITAQRCTTFTRYQLRCACGWDRTTDSLGVGELFDLTVHLDECGAVSQPWTGEEDRQLWNGSIREVARSLGRSRSAVNSRRETVTRSRRTASERA
jgi:hypothetical protein